MAVIPIPKAHSAKWLMGACAAAALFAFANVLVKNESLSAFVLLSLPLGWVILSESPRRIEGALVFYGLVYSFGYLALKPAVYSTYLWVVVPPGLSLIYVFLTRPGWHRLVLANGLDRGMFAYLAYGTAMTALGMAIGTPPGDLLQTYMQAYLPAVLYFVARPYTQGSETRIRNAFDMIWLVCLVIAVDGVVEYYVLEELRNYELIPWTAANTNNALASLPGGFLARNPMIPFHHISILDSEKVLSMAVSAFGCFTAGLLLQSQGRQGPGAIPCRFLNWKPANLVLFFTFLSLSVVLTSYAATAAFFFVLFVQAMFVRTGRFRVIFLFTLFISGCLFVLKDWLIALYVYKFTAGAIADGRSAAEHTFSIKSVFDIYAASPLNLVLGSALLEPGSVRGGSGTELRLLVYPVHYGIGWAIIAARLSWSILGICRGLIAYRGGSHPVNGLGLAGLGFFLIYFTDVHYPSFDRHGPFELMFIMAAVFASLDEKIREREVCVPANGAARASGGEV